MIPALTDCNDVDYLAGKTIDLLQLGSPFDAVVTQFLSELSSTLLKSPDVKPFPELVALGYWIRPANISTLYKRLTQTENILTKPIGVVLHIAPSNVDIQFFYSWVLSVLMGNSNIVRVSQVASASKSMLLSFLRSLLQKSTFQSIAQSNVFVTWPHNDHITKTISAQVDARMLWGSDESITHIRSFPTKVGGRDVVFSDKYSLTVIDSSNINSVAEFCELLHRDISAFSQNACSSPRVIFDLNRDKQVLCSIARGLNERSHNLTFSATRGVNHLFTLQMLAARGYLDNVIQLPKIQVLELNSFSPEFLDWHMGEAQLFWVHLDSLQQLSEFINEKCQTISYFGVSKEQLLSFLKRLPITSIDRLVPLGRALDFDVFWDGYDLFSELSRKVTVI